ncbi:tyrosine-type recombinase/integrase [Singulisphaera sp. PoT]|uniref:tyrosine-type recombinase/integrase n=1 Tax=Singulisphaera sp. PoT TaxID=3411797 RepID=UPI003BF4B0A0
MPRLTKKLPSYRLHRASGQAVVTLAGRDHYLGPHGTAASKAEYDRVLAEYLSNGRRDAAREASVSVGELLLAYLRYAEGHFTRDGKPTRHVDNIKDAIRPLRKLYSHTPAEDFDAAALKSVRKAMIDAGLSRNTANARIKKIKTLFSWAAEERLVSATVLHEIRSVRSLQRGRDGVRETAPVRPVPTEHVQAVLRFVSPPVAAMIQVQALTGMRPGEVMAMRAGDIARDGEVWLYRPRRHKTDYLGQGRVVFLGPKAQEILVPWIVEDPDAYLFSPKRYAEARRRASGRGAISRPRAVKRSFRERYQKNSYANAITLACQKAGIPAWGPNRLRHSAATSIRQRFGLEAAQSVLGHMDVKTTQIYAERHLERARDIMGEIG